MQNPKVSIVLPTYNGEKFLSDAINSIINQTYQDWELIIVNDCSTDKSLEIAEEFAQKDARIRVITNEVNKKLPESLNVGFRVAKGEYYTWTSDDNEYYPQAIEKLAEFLDNNKDFGMVYAKCKVTGTFEGDYWGNMPTTPLILLDFPTPAACFMYRADIAKQVGEYDTKAVYMEDHDYWIRLLLKAPIANIDEELYMYRRHQDSLTVKSGDIAAKLRISLLVKYYPIYKQAFPQYKDELAEKFELLIAVYNQDESAYSKLKGNYNKRALYSRLKKIYRLNNSEWALNHIFQLGGIYIIKGLLLFIKRRINK